MEVINMETTIKPSSPIPNWVHWCFERPWYMWLGWLAETALLFTFISVVYTQFAEGEVRGGWVMIVMTLLTCGPGIWILLGYRPEAGSTFGKYDIGLIICFAIWFAIFGYLFFWNVEFYPGPFGSPHLSG